MWTVQINNSSHLYLIHSWGWFGWHLSRLFRKKRTTGFSKTR